jgi:hypothetical protein
MKANIFSKKVFLIIVLLNTFFIQAQNKPTDKSKEVKIGVYIDDIYNIDYLNSSYEVIFYLWSNSYQKKYNTENIDVDKCTDLTTVYNEKDSVKTNFGFKYKHLTKYKATILNDMDFSKFPFDKLELKLNIELLEHYTGDKNITFDKNSVLMPKFVDKWERESVSYEIKPTEWESKFGDISNHTIAQQDTFNMKINLSRQSWNLYWKMFLVLFISLFLASLNLFLPNKRSEEKFALIVGSLFTAIGNKYITESYLPFSDKINLCDILHIITFIFISLFALFAIYEQRQNRKDSLKLDTKLFLISIFTYFTLVLIITYHFV